MINVKVTYVSGRTQNIDLDFKDFREAMNSTLQYKWLILKDYVLNIDEIESIELNNKSS